MAMLNNQRVNNHTINPGFDLPNVQIHGVFWRFPEMCVDAKHFCSDLLRLCGSENRPEKKPAG